MHFSEAERGFVLSKQADGRAAKTVEKHYWSFRLFNLHFGDPF